MPKQIDRDMLKKLKDLNKAGNYDALVQYICEQTLTLSTNHDDMSLYDTVNEFYDEILQQFDEKSKANVLEIGKAFTRYDVRTFMEAGKEADKVAEQIKNGEIEELKYVENDKVREKLSAGIVITQSDFTPKLRANKSADLTFRMALANDPKWEKFVRDELMEQKNQEMDSYKNSFPGIAPKDKERYMKRFIGQVQRLVPIEGFTFNENYKPGQSRFTKYPAHYKLLNDANTTEELDKLEKTTAEECEHIKIYQQGFFDTENEAKKLSKALEDSTSEEAKKTKEYKELMEAVNLLKAISKGIVWYGIDFDGTEGERSVQPFSSSAAKYALNQVREKAEAFKGIDENAANAAISFAKSRSDVNQHNYEKNYKPLRDKYDNLDAIFFTPESMMEHITAIQHKKADIASYHLDPNKLDIYKKYGKQADAINAYAEAVDKIRSDAQLGGEIQTMLDDMADRKNRRARRTTSYDTFVSSIDKLKKAKEGIETTPAEYRKSLVDAIAACDDYRDKHKGLFNGNFGKGPARYNASISIGNRLREHLKEFDKAYLLYPGSKEIKAADSKAQLIAAQHSIVEAMDNKRKYFDTSMSKASDAHRKYTDEMDKTYKQFFKPDNMTKAEFFAQKKAKFAELLAKTAAVGAAIKETKNTYDLLARKVSAEDVAKMKSCADKFSDESLASSTNAIKNSKGFKDMVDSITDDDTMSAVLYIALSGKGEILSEEIERRTREVEAREQQAAEQERRRKLEEENDLLKPAYYDPNNFKPGEIIPYQNDIRDVLSEGEPTSDQDFNTKKDKIMRATAKLISTKASWNLPEKRTISQIRQELGDEGFASYRKEYKKVSKECEKNAQRLYTESGSFKYMFDMVTNWEDLKELSKTALSPTGNGIIFKLRAAKEAYLEAEKIKQQGRISTTKTDPNKTIIPK